MQEEPAQSIPLRKSSWFEIFQQQRAEMMLGLRRLHVLTDPYKPLSLWQIRGKV